MLVQKAQQPRVLTATIPLCTQSTQQLALMFITLRIAKCAIPDVRYSSL